MNTYITSFAVWLSNQRKSPQTVQAYCGEVRRFSEFALKTSALSIDRCRKQELTELFFQYMKIGKLSQSALNRRYYAIQSLFEYFHFTVPFPRPVLPISRETPGSKAVAKKSAAISLKSGTRSSGKPESLVELRNKAMTFLAVYCRLPATVLKELDLTSVQVEGKTSVFVWGEVSLKLPSSIQKAVLSYLVARAAKNFTSQWLFVNRNGERLSLRSIQHGMKEYLKRCGNSPEYTSVAKTARALSGEFFNMEFSKIFDRLTGK